MSEALSKDTVDSFKVAELRSFLTERELPTTGVKSVLVSRLKEALELEEDDAEVDILGDAPVQPKPTPKATPKATVAKVAPEAKPAEGAGPVAAAVATETDLNDELEDRKKRAARFGVPLVESEAAPKKKVPATKSTTKSAPKSAPNAKRSREVASELVDPAKMAARAKKFGVIPPAKALVADEVKDARAKRFQVQNPDEEKLASRAARFSGSQ